jgi:hypothetical protein
MYAGQIVSQKSTERRTECRFVDAAPGVAQSPRSESPVSSLEEVLPHRLHADKALLLQPLHSGRRGVRKLSKKVDFHDERTE